MDAAPTWEDMQSATDFVVPLNFGSSHSATTPIPSFFPRSPRKATPVRVRPGSPWLRSPSIIDHENTQDNNMDDNADGGWGFAPLQDASSDDSDNEADQPQEIMARRVDVPPTEYFSAAYEDDQEPEVVNNDYPSPRADIESPRGRSSKPSPLSRSRDPSSVVAPTQASSQPPTNGSSTGKPLSQRFAELEKKLTAEGRSFRFSEIGTLPSSPAISPSHNGTDLKFPDLPSSSPDKSVAKDDEEQDESHVENESSSKLDDEGQAERTGMPRHEPSTENVLNENLSQEDTEDTSMEEPEYSLEPHQGNLAQESAEHSYQASAEVVAVAVTNASRQSDDSVHDVSAGVEAQELKETFTSEEATPPIRHIVDIQNEELDQEDASFIAPIPTEDSPRMDDSVSVTSEDSEQSNDTDEDEIIAESTYEQDIQPQHLSSLSADRYDVSQDPSYYPSKPAEVAETMDDEVVGHDETIEEEMNHGPSWEDETDAEPLVQIRSNDPMAAARAAAILNLVSSHFAPNKQVELT